LNLSRLNYGLISLIPKPKRLIQSNSIGPFAF
jgi:hypothetical protein